MDFVYTNVINYHVNQPRKEIDKFDANLLNHNYKTFHKDVKRILLNEGSHGLDHNTSFFGSILHFLSLINKPAWLGYTIVTISHSAQGRNSRSERKSLDSSWNNIVDCRINFKNTILPTKTSISPQVWALFPWSSPPQLSTASWWQNLLRMLRRSRGRSTYVVAHTAAAGPRIWVGSRLKWRDDPLPTRLTFAEFSHLNLSDKMPEHIFTSEILLHSLDLVGGHQLLDGGQIAGNPLHHKELLLEDELKIFIWVIGQTDWKSGATNKERKK